MINNIENASINYSARLRHPWYGCCGGGGDDGVFITPKCYIVNNFSGQPNGFIVSADITYYNRTNHNYY